MEELLMTWTEDHMQKRVALSTMTITITVKGLQCGKKRLDPTKMLNLLLALGGLTNSRIVIHYVM
jgi:hypothetical protein